MKLLMMNAVTFTDVEIGDVLYLDRPPYCPMEVVAKVEKITLTGYPARALEPRKTLTADAFDAAGYVRYEEADA